MPDHPVIRFPDLTHTRTESRAADRFLRLKPTRFASGNRNIHWPDPSRCRPLHISSRADHPQDLNQRLDVEIRLRSHASVTQDNAGLPLRDVPDRESQNQAILEQASSDSEYWTCPFRGSKRKSNAGSRISPQNTTGRWPPDHQTPPITSTKTAEPSQSPYTLNRSAPENQPAARTESGIRCQYPIQSANNTSPARTRLPPPHPPDYPNSNQYKPGIHCVCRVGIC